MLSVVILSAIMLNVIILSVVILSVVILNVGAPFKIFDKRFGKKNWLQLLRILTAVQN